MRKPHHTSILEEAERAEEAEALPPRGPRRLARLYPRRAAGEWLGKQAVHVREQRRYPGQGTRGGGPKGPLSRRKGPGSTRGTQQEHKRNTRGTQESNRLSPRYPLSCTRLVFRLRVALGGRSALRFHPSSLPLN